MSNNILEDEAISWQAESCWPTAHYEDLLFFQAVKSEREQDFLQKRQRLNGVQLLSFIHELLSSVTRLSSNMLDLEM